MLRRIYDQGERPQLDAVLSPCVALLHLAGVEYQDGELSRHIEANVFSLLAAAGPSLKAVIKREGESLTCPELGTVYRPRGGVTTTLLASMPRVFRRRRV